jgi:hypothetical protein
MKIASILALVAIFLLPACKSGGSDPENFSEVREEAPDAKPMLYVAEEDQRFVATPNAGDRQVHYYSAKNDRTYVVDEMTGKVVTSYATKKMPGVVVIDKRPAEGTASAGPTFVAEPEAPSEGCGCAAPEEEPAPEEEAAPEGCGEGCGG